MIASFENKEGTVIEELCDWSSLNRSVYYYQVREGKPGRAVSTTTCMKDGSIVPNETVVATIRAGKRVKADRYHFNKFNSKSITRYQP